MKKALSLILAVVIMLASVSFVSAAQENIGNAKIDRIASELFDGERSLSAEEFNRFIDEFGVFFAKGDGGFERLCYSATLYLKVTLEEGEDPSKVFTDNGIKAEVMEKAGLKNSEYYTIMYSDSHYSFYSDSFGENEYPFFVYINENAREELGINALSPIETLYLETLVFAGREYTYSMFMTDGLYNESERFVFDANLDGTFNIKDYALIKTYIASGNGVCCLSAMDSDGDGRVGIKDFKTMKSALAGT